jgi:3-oxoacyl-[acyl-carrier-protein] synthase-3
VKHVLLISGDRAFTQQQRILQNASIAGDAAAAVLLSRDSESGLKLICSDKQVFPRFMKGAWLDKDLAKDFELNFAALMAGSINACLVKAGLSLEQIRFILPHNVNRPVWEKIAKNLDCSFGKIYSHNIGRYGHCFSTDSLINLTTVIPELNAGDYILLATVGFGLTFATAIFQKEK